MTTKREEDTYCYSIGLKCPLNRYLLNLGPYLSAMSFVRLSLSHQRHLLLLMGDGEILAPLSHAMLLNYDMSDFV